MLKELSYKWRVEEIYISSQQLTSYIRNHGQLTKVNVINTHFLKQTLQDNLGVLLRFTASTAAAAYFLLVKGAKAHGRFMYSHFCKMKTFSLLPPHFSKASLTLLLFLYI